VNNGDHVLQHDRVAEVLVGGMLFHVTSPAEGTVQHAIESEGARLRPGDPLGFVHTSNVQ
jgi:biotin carboxyl carrier protein